LKITRKGLISIVCGAALLSLIGAGVATLTMKARRRADHQRYIAQKLEMWSSEGATPGRYARRVLEIQERYREEIPPSKHDILVITAGLSGGDHRFIKARAMGVLETFAQKGILPAGSQPEIADAASPLLRDPAPLLRVRAACLLRYVGDRRSARALLPLLNDPEPIARQRAREALEAFGYAIPAT
jgi:HEAT repeat protein